MDPLNVAIKRNSMCPLHVIYHYPHENLWHLFTWEVVDSIYTLQPHLIKKLQMHTHIQYTTFLGSCGIYCCLVPKLCPTLLQPHGLQPTRHICPWDFPGKNTGVSCHFLLQAPSQPRHGTCVVCIGGWMDSLPLNHQGSPWATGPPGKSPDERTW